MANLSNINNYFIVDTSGKGVFGDVASFSSTQHGPLNVFKSGAAAAICIDSSGGSGRMYQLRSETSGSFVIYDNPSCEHRMEISSGGDATFGGAITVKSGNKLILNRPNNAIDCELSTDSSGTLILNSRNSEGFKFQNNGTNFVTGDSSNNVTFANEITSGDDINAGGKVVCANVGTDKKIAFRRTGANNWSIEHDASQIYFYNETGTKDVLLMKNAGQIMLGEYGSGTFTGTVAKNLAVDSSGNIIETDGGVVDGSGTANDVAMWSDSNTLTDAPIAISGNNATFTGQIGLGGTGIYTNSASLNIDGLGLAIKNDTAGSSNNWSLIKNTATSSESNIVFISGAGTAVTINHDKSVIFEGNVGIGTASPAALLDVSSGTTTDVIRFGADSRWGFSRANSDNRYLSFMRNQNGSGTAVWTVDGDNGKVGIGTTTPDEKLDITGGYLKFNGGDYGLKGSASLSYNATSDHYFQSGGSTKVTFKADGKVGIGTGAPYTNLEVIGGLNVSTNTTSATTTTMRIGSYGASSQTYYGAKLVAHTNFTATANADLSFDLGDLGEIMRLHCSGTETRVGIGTTSPSRKLHIDAGSSYPFRVDSTQQYLMEFARNGTSEWWIAVAGGFKIHENGVGDHMIIQDGGNVGIGTTSPNPFSWGNKHLTCVAAGTNQYFGLDIVGSGSGSGAIIFGGGSGSGTATNIARAQITALDGSDLAFYTNGNNSGSSFSERIRIKSGGNVGINTTTPQTTLEVDGASSAFNAHFGQGQDNNSGVFGGISLGYAEANTSYRKVGLVAKALADGAARQDFCILVDTVSDSGSAALADTKFKIDGLTGDTTITGTVTATADVVAYSDKKLKKNIKTLDGSKVYDMRGVSFTRKDNGNERSGVIAQEIQKIAPELVNETDGTLGVAYGNLTGYLIEAVKELKAEIEELKKQIK